MQCHRHIVTLVKTHRMASLILMAWLLLTFSEIESVSINKCCPAGYAMTKEYQGESFKYCVYDHNTDQREYYPGIEVQPPSNINNSLRELVDHCQGHMRLKVSVLEPNDQFQLNNEGKIEWVSSTTGSINTLEQDTCMDWMIDETKQTSNIILVTCPCSHTPCLHLCCPSGDLGVDDGPCGAPWPAWENAVQPIWDHGITPNLQQPSEAPCLREGPLGGMKHPAIRTAEIFRLVTQDRYNVDGRLLRGSEFCLGLNSLSVSTVENPEPNLRVYYCDTLPQVLPGVRSPETLDMYEHVTWLAAVGSAFTVLTLALSALKGENAGLPGFMLMLYCFVTIIALLTLAYTPVAISHPGVFAPPKQACRTVAYVLHYTMLTSFTLLILRILSIFATIKSARMPWHRKDSKMQTWWAKLLFFILILITPAILTCIALGLDTMGPKYYTKIVTIDMCWFSSGERGSSSPLNLIYLYCVPTLVLLALALCFLGITCARSRSSTVIGGEIMSTSIIQKDRFRLYLGGIALTGVLIYWLAETLCFLVAWPDFWLPISVLLAVRGFIILLIRATPPRVWRLICCCCCIAPSSSPTDDEVNLTSQISKSDSLGDSTAEAKNPFESDEEKVFREKS